METIYQIYEKAPALIPVPIELHDLPVEVVIKPLINEPCAVDENGWPIGFFAETYGSLPALPERAP